MQHLQTAEIQERLAEVQQSVCVIWSTLEAVHSAMRENDDDPRAYMDCIYGMSIWRMSKKKS